MDADESEDELARWAEHFVPMIAKRVVGDGWTARLTPRGRGVEILEGEDQVALLWWDQDGCWVRRFPTPPNDAQPFDEFFGGGLPHEVATFIRKNNPARPRRKRKPKPAWAPVAPTAEARATSEPLSDLATTRKLAAALRASIKARHLPFKVSVDDGDVYVLDRKRNPLGEFFLGDEAFHANQFLADEMQDSRYVSFEALTVEDAMDQLLDTYIPS